jgi:hypothetical protein
VPTSADSVYFDASSFSSAGQAVTVNVAANCLDMDWTGALNSPVLAGSSDLNIYGSLTFILAMTVTKTGTIYARATATGKTINCPINVSASFNFNGSGGGWTLQSNIVTTGNVDHNAGTLNTSNYNITCANFNSISSTARTLTLGSSVLTVSGYWNFGSPTNLTFNANTSKIIMTGALQFRGGGLTYNNVEFTGTPITITGSNTFADLKFTAGKTVNVTAGTTQTVTTLSGEGTSGSLITIQSVTAGSPFTISKASGILTVYYYSIKDCTATGGATFKAYYSLNISGNTGWDFIQLPKQSSAHVAIGLFV